MVAGNMKSASSLPSPLFNYCSLSVYFNNMQFLVAYNFQSSSNFLVKALCSYGDVAAELFCINTKIFTGMKELQ